MTWQNVVYTLLSKWTTGMEEKWSVMSFPVTTAASTGMHACMHAIWNVRQ